MAKPVGAAFEFLFLLSLCVFWNFFALISSILVHNKLRLARRDVKFVINVVQLSAMVAVVVKIILNSVNSCQKNKRMGFEQANKILKFI